MIYIIRVMANFFFFYIKSYIYILHLRSIIHICYLPIFENIMTDVSQIELVSNDSIEKLRSVFSSKDEETFKDDLYKSCILKI